jgi:nucleoid DNA-binding protein
MSNRELTIGDVDLILKSGKRVIIPGFGTFKMATSKARMGRNPKTGAAVAIPAKRRVHFKPNVVEIV